MLDLSANEVWFVTGSQHLYGPETLATVADHAATDRRRAGRRGGHPGQGRGQAGPHRTRRDPPAVPGGECRRRAASD